MNADAGVAAIAGAVDFSARRPNPKLPVDRTSQLGVASFGFTGARSSWNPATAGTGLYASRQRMIVGDIRLDHREALAHDLGVAAGQPDHRFVLCAVEAWGRASFDRLRGDYAFALWDEGQEELLLVRGPLSANQLFFRVEKGRLSFASSAQLLLRFAGDRALDVDSAARFIAGLPAPGRSTFFAGIRRLEHSHMLAFSARGVEEHRYWKPRRLPPGGGSIDDLADELRDRVDRAVGERLKRSEGFVAAQLSAGRDSGAVFASAAHILAAKSESLLAFTHVPKAGFERSLLRDRLDDEGEIAAATAANFRQVRHCLIRSGADAFAGVSEAHAIMPNPIPHLSNRAWGQAIQGAAASSGATVLLNGNVGNFSVSAGGPMYLRSLLKEEGRREWWKVAGAGSQRPADLARLARWTFGGGMPANLHRAVRRMVRGPSLQADGLRLLRTQFRDRLAKEVADELADTRPPDDPFAFRAEMLMAHDPSNAVGRILHGLDGRDPTSDRDLIEFSMSVPVDMIVDRDGGRPLYEQAFEGRLDSRQLRPTSRGYQGADWSMAFTREAVATHLQRWRGHPHVEELLDLAYIDRMLESWPQRWSDPALMLHYRNDLLGAVAVANFVGVNF